ncbi:MAG: segregation/condensation protein A [Elusimicrobia bacterium]|nr:segregation/condensation protein A [Elusimicrobiota bacterium]
MTANAVNEVKLEVFEGPLDLLLYLIKKNDLNIYDIPISQITAEYLGMMDVLKDLDLNLAGEFLVMAATLMQIKARTLLPAPSSAAEEEEDPRANLVERLLEYQRFKEAARHLEQKLQTSKDVHYRGSPHFNDTDFTMEASLFDLLDAFRDVLKNLKPRVREIESDDVPIEVKIKDVLAFLASRPFATFKEILQREATRRGLIITFLAVLELIRLRQIAARQTESFGEIRVYHSHSLPQELAEDPVAQEPVPAPAAPLPEPVGGE